ncbi:uncharacterized protein LOC128203395 [Mya arenaria]|uniref:uncharacterized protein LOC128203395 n=1 Tax=Mya arenaria TaxID=6604 RepID=UPI0022E117DA|nr:uncharacterized protein LOC128203395 [Mya arenaria]
MRYLFLCLLPLVLGAPKTRFVLDSLGSIFDQQILKCDVQLIIDVVGSHPTEQACEAECHKIIADGHFLNYGCPLVCLGLESFAHTLHLVPDPVDANDPCGRPPPSLATTTASEGR